MGLGALVFRCVSRRCARLSVIIDAQGLDALAELLFPVGSLFLCLDLGLALSVGGLGLLEDADEVLALR